MEQKKSNNLALCIICGVLTAFGIVASIISLASGSNGIWLVSDMILLVLTLLVGYYAVYGYRKPHGDMLKYVILIFGVTILINVYIWAQEGLAWTAVYQAIIIGLLCYVAGRLHRAKQNLILMIIVAILIAVEIILGYVNGVNTIGALTKLIILLDICVAYFLRYKEHKLAGLMDKEKN